MHKVLKGGLAMATKSTYPCFACRKAGFEVQVFLDGKDDQGRTKYLNEDGTRHYHQGASSTASEVLAQHGHQAQPPRQQEQGPQMGDLMLILKLLTQKVDQVLDLLKEQQQEKESMV
jgi:hypothetical protein